MFSQLGYYICIPFAWLTRLFYSVTGSYGLAIILFTLVVKLVILPFQMKSKKSMLRLNRMQGKIKDIQTRFANDKVRQQEEMQALYAKEGVNPMGGCLWSFIPFPILIALYAIIRTPLRFFMNLSLDTIDQVTALANKLGYMAPEKAGAYDQIYLVRFIHENWSQFAGKFDKLIDVDYSFLGMDLSAVGKDLFHSISGGGWAVIGVLLMPLIAAALQFVMSVVSMKASSNSINGSSKTMLYMMPLMTVWMGYILPAALCLYWIANSAFSAIQEKLLNDYFGKRLDQEETAKEKAAREKRLAKYEQQKAMMQARQGQTKPSQPAKKKAPQKESDKGGSDKRAATTEAGRVGQRPYARGRAYSESHYDDN